MRTEETCFKIVDWERNQAGQGHGMDCVPEAIPNVTDRSNQEPVRCSSADDF
jgi:hypothetical protein